MNLKKLNKKNSLNEKKKKRKPLLKGRQNGPECVTYY